MNFSDASEQSIVLNRSRRRRAVSKAIIPGRAYFQHPAHCHDRELHTMRCDEGVLYRTSLAKYAAAFFNMARSSSNCLTLCRNSKFSCSSGGRCPCWRNAVVPSVFAALTHRDNVHGEMPRLCAASHPVVRLQTSAPRHSPPLAANAVNQLSVDISSLVSPESHARASIWQRAAD